MKKIDSHTHTYFSFDGKMDLNSLVGQAAKEGYSYLAVTEHLDCDYLFCKDTGNIKQLDLNAYKKGFKAALSLVPKGMYLAFGIECGYCHQAEGHYRDVFSKMDFDVIINSVHSLDNTDIYRAVSGLARGKKDLYLKYLSRVLESIRADYPYHIVGHLGYITRYANFLDSDLYNAEANALTEEILKEIIDRGKTLEINAKGAADGFLPSVFILEKYYNLGGRDITYGSDAHILSGLGAGYPAVTKTLSDIGFNRWTVYVKGEKKFVSF